MAFDSLLEMRAVAALNLAASATSSDAAKELAGGGVSNGKLAVVVQVADADADLACDFEVSLDNGTTYRTICRVEIPFAFKGIKTVDVGTYLRTFRYAAASVQCRTTWVNLSGANAYAGTVGAYIGDGSEDIFGKKADDTLMV